MNSVLKSWSAILIGFFLISFSLPAHADGIDNDALRKVLGTGNAAIKPDDATIKPIEDDILRLTTNKDKLIRLDQDAASVIVNNPDHANVMLDSPRLLIVMPRQPGATSFSVLDAAGKTILHKEIIVTNVQPQYVRIRRVCQGGGACEPTSYFYCPNGCYEVTTQNGGGGGNVPAPVTPPGAHSHAGDTGGNGNGGGGDSGQLAPPQNPINSTTMPATGGGL